MSVTEKIDRLVDRCRNYKLQILALQKEYNLWTEKKAQVIKSWSEDLATLYDLQERNKRDIAQDIITQLEELRAVKGGFDYVYECIDDEYKNENSRQLFKRYASKKPEQQNLNESVEEDILEDVKAIEEKLEKLPASRKAKLMSKVSEYLKEEPKKQPVKEEDFGVHQEEPPAGMQGPNAFSEAVRGTAKWFYATADHYKKIADEIETYKPTTEERINEKARDWVEHIGGIYKDDKDKTFITGKIIHEILDPIFNTETKAEADRKWSTSVFHWIGIIKNRIEQSKHGAGKMAENTLTSPFGKIVYNKKNKAIKKPISRERVGDFERPVVDMAIEIISANAGLVQLHDWLENDQGGYRRYRKEFLHDYFAEASMGSIKSGNPEYPQFMREYKVKQLAKFKPEE